MSLSQGQAQWLVDFMRHLPGSDAQQPQSHVQAPQHYDPQAQRHVEHATPYYDYPGHQSYDEYPHY
jgi:hypothetical protein